MAVATAVCAAVVFQGEVVVVVVMVHRSMVVPVPVADYVDRMCVLQLVFALVALLANAMISKRTNILLFGTGFGFDFVSY